MPITIEANLKVPSFTIKSGDQPDRRVDNASVRFLKRITVEALPKVGETLVLSTEAGGPFDAVVSRVDWADDKELFVVACTFARRSITPAEHELFLTDPHWRTNYLP